MVFEDQSLAIKTKASLTDYILFNELKHHLHAAQQLAHSNDVVEVVIQQLKKLGNSKMDLYHGMLSTEEVKTEIAQQIPIQNQDEYAEWIAEEKGFRLIEIRDTSSWTLRHAKDQPQYIHLHPAKYSPHSFRINASIFKTAILTVYFSETQQSETLSTKLVNKIRKRHLDLPPVKSLEQASSLRQIIEMLVKPWSPNTTAETTRDSTSVRRMRERNWR